MLARDHKEVLSEKMRSALMISVLPGLLQDRIAEYLDRLTTYNEVHDKVVSLIQSSSKYAVGDAMDCSSLERDDYYGNEGEDIDTDAISKNHCSRSDGFGHYARDCATPAGKAKGGGKNGKASSRPTEETHPGKGGLFCTHCKRANHTKDKCFDLYPELKTKGKGKGKGKYRRIAGLDEDAEQDEEETLGVKELGSLECSPCGGAFEDPHYAASDTPRETSPHVSQRNK